MIPTDHRLLLMLAAVALGGALGWLDDWWRERKEYRR